MSVLAMSPLSHVRRVVLAFLVFAALLFGILLWQIQTPHSFRNYFLSTGMLSSEEDIQLIIDHGEKNTSPSPSIPSPATLSSSPAPPSTTPPTLQPTRTSLLYLSPTPTPVLPKLFLYLLETESCLPNYITPQDAVGNEAACKCDVIVLSFRKKCSTPMPAKHMRYVEFNESFKKLSWGEGRNVLYEISQKLKVKYHYYIFLDDDAYLLSRGEKPYNPWREFENFLLRVEPAVGIADGSGNQRAVKAQERRKALNCTLNYTAEYLPSPRFDACFNAFHHKAINHLLPYVTKYDNQSWWWAARSVEAISDIAFPGQVLIHVDIYAMNTKHRGYPRKLASDNDMELILQELEKRIPKRYRASRYLHEMRVNKQEHENIASSLCLPPAKPHEIIVPYRQTL